MSNIPPADFSFDLYPGLDADLEAAYERNVETGLVTAEETATGGLAAAIQNTIGNTTSTPNVLAPKEAEQWAVQEIIRAGNAYYNLRTELGVSVPTSFTELANIHKDFEPTTKRLYEAKQALLSSGEVTPNGTNVGETMQLVLVPWQGFYQALESGNTVNQILRVRQNQAITVDEYMNDDLQKAIRDGDPMYRDPDNPSNFIGAKAYLEKKLELDGAWGMMLVQTSNEAGVERLRGQSPNQMTANGEDRLVLGDTVVDNMGIFEWLATTFQEDPRQLSVSDYSWMLANRLDVNGGPYAPCGYWDDVQVRSYLFRADYQYDDMRPRLAVM